MSQDKQFLILKLLVLFGSVTTQLITYWERKGTLKYNANPITNERNFRGHLFEIIAPVRPQVLRRIDIIRSVERRF